LLLLVVHVPTATWFCRFGDKGSASRDPEGALRTLGSMGREDYAVGVFGMLLIALGISATSTAKQVLLIPV
jgi:hypothetical protein